MLILRMISQIFCIKVNFEDNFMIKIGIYAESIDKKKIKKSITQYLNKISIESDINYMKTKDEVLSISNPASKYNIMIICENNEIKYIKKNSVNYKKKVVQLTSGVLDSALSDEILDEIILSANGYGCPHGIYKINDRKTFRLIPHEDIEYFHCSKEESMVFLTNNETEKIFHSAKSIKEELSEDYFINSSKGYLVNLFNVKKIDRVNNEIIFKSGRKIPISRKNFQNTIRMLIKAIYGFDI